MSTLRKFKKVVVAAGLSLTTTVWLASAVLMAPTALAYSDGDLLKDASTANIYVVNNGMKVWVRSAAVFDDCSYDWAKIKTVSNLSATPTADLIKSASNPDVYRLEKNFKRKLASTEIFTSYSLDWNKVGTVCQHVLDSYSIAPLIQQTSSPDIYWVQTDTLKHKMTSWQSFVDHGFNIADVIGINAMEMGSYSEGAEIGVTPTVTKSITVVAPNGGESYTAGNTVNIKWQSQEVSKVSIYLSDAPMGTTGGSDYSIATNIDTVSGSYTWLIPGDFFIKNPEFATGNNFRIRIYNYTVDNNTATKDESNNNFSIVSAPLPTCSDSDNGINYEVPGTINGLSNPMATASSESDDYCLDQNTLIEYSCLDDHYQQKNTYTCPYGCENRACNKKPYTSIKIGNPGLVQFPNSDSDDRIARGVQDLQAYQGRIYVGDGDASNNRGPIKV